MYGYGVVSRYASWIEVCEVVQNLEDAQMWCLHLIVIGFFWGWGENHCCNYEFPYCHLSFAFFFAAYDEPYLLALLADCIEIRTEEPCLFIQSVPLSKSRLVFRCHQGLVYVASTDYVWCLQAVPLTQQIHILLEDKQFQLALRLTVCTMIRMKLCITFEIHCRT